jgi:simple sugar transport system permease protein
MPDTTVSTASPTARAAPPPAAAPGRNLLKELLVRREASVLAVAAGLFVYFQLTTTGFLSGSNLETIATFVAATAIIAAAEAMLMITGEIDLSVGQVFALSPFLMHFGLEAGVPLILAVVLAIAACSLVGLLNGAVTVWLQVPSFITTLGTLYLISGVTLMLSDGAPREVPAPSKVVDVLGAQVWAGIIWAVVIVAVLHAVLRHTRWGIHSVAVGGNPVGAEEAGISRTRIKIGTFMLCSALAAFAGILEALRIQTIDPLAGGSSIMFAAVAAAVVGGTALTGGIGTVIGAFLGAVMLGTLRNGFTLQGVDAFTFDLILGIAILAAMAINVSIPRVRQWRARRT